MESCTALASINLVLLVVTLAAVVYLVVVVATAHAARKAPPNPRDLVAGAAMREASYPAVFEDLATQGWPSGDMRVARMRAR